MPTYNSIRLKFTADFELGDKLRMVTILNDAFYNGGLWEWVATRSSTLEVTTGTPTANAGERTAINFKSAFDLDNVTGYTTTIENVNEVLIESETVDEIFQGVSVRTTNGAVTPTIDNSTTDSDTISAITSRVEKYYISYCDDFNTDREVIISERGFIGQSQQLTADVNPISILYDSSDDFLFSPIRPSVATVNMIFGTGDGIDFEEFWTADERQFLVEDVKDGTTEWSGFVTTNGFSYDFKGGLYYANLEASDGLGSLESITFVDDDDKPYGNQDLTYNTDFSFPFSLVITEILRKLGLNLDLWVCIDSYEVNMTTTGDVRAAEPLSNAYVDVRTYIKEGENENVPYWFGSGEEWNCQEVLENILYIFGAKLYQEVGVWRIKSINADVDFGTGGTQRYWRKYNNVGTYLGDYETVNDERAIPCNDSTKYLLNDDHVMSMDDVYKAFRMNYEYQFLRDGDTPLNLLPNGNFCNFNNASELAAPDGWYRYRLGTFPYIRIKPITLAVSDAGGSTCGLELGTHAPGIPNTSLTTQFPSRYTSLAISNTITVRKNDNITLEMWNRFQSYDPDDGNRLYYACYQMVLNTANNVYFLRNSIVDNKRALTWEEAEVITRPFGDSTIRQIWFYVDAAWSLNGNTTNEQQYTWLNSVYELQRVPDDGNLEFYITGIFCNRRRFGQTNDENVLLYREGTDLFQGWPVTNWVDNGGTLQRHQITGLKVGVIPDENELPQQQDFIYENTNENYTLQVDPITVYNGDLQDAFHVSNITVPSNTTGGKNFWDDLGATYGSSSLGLLTVREIMRQYHKPRRILEGNLKLQDARFGSVYTFDVLSDVRFVLQRGTFNKQKQFIEDAMFVEILDDALPDGGRESGNTLDPEWRPTGVTYCETDVNDLHTGYVIIQEEDVNPNSETYQETREVVSASQDLTQCPLGNPIVYYWGTDDVYLNTNTLVFAPFEVISPKEIQIEMFNTDGNYIYFVHLKSLGVVERIYTVTSPGNVLDDWVYLDDVIINGFRYRVLRSDYVMAEFSNFTHNFVFA